MKLVVILLTFLKHLIKVFCINVKVLGFLETYWFFFHSYLNNIQQRVVLNGQYSKWAPILVGVPQGSILVPLLFLIYINDLSKNLKSSAKIFADDTSLFSAVYNATESANLLNEHLKKISEWAFSWIMLFNSDITKQSQEVIFFS